MNRFYKIWMIDLKKYHSPGYHPVLSGTWYHWERTARAMGRRSYGNTEGSVWEIREFSISEEYETKEANNG